VHLPCVGVAALCACCVKGFFLLHNSALLHHGTTLTTHPLFTHPTAHLRPCMEPPDRTDLYEPLVSRVDDLTQNPFRATAAVQAIFAIAQAAPTTPAAAAAVATFGPAVAKVMRSAAGHPLPDMGRAPALSTQFVSLMAAGEAVNYACGVVNFMCYAGLPAQQMEALQQHCLLPLVELLAASGQSSEARKLAAGAISELLAQPATAAGMRLGGAGDAAHAGLWHG